MSEISTKGDDFQLPPKLDLTGPRVLIAGYVLPKRQPAYRLKQPRPDRPLAAALQEYSGTRPGDFTCDVRLG